MEQSYSRKWGTIYQKLRYKMSLLCLQILLMLFFNHHETSALANSFGKYFVVAVPRLRQQRSTDIPSIHFYLSTVFSAKDVEVFITTPHYGDSTLKHFLVIPKDGFREYSLDRKYFSNQEIGKKWTYLLAGKEYFGLYVMLIENEKSVATFQALPIEEWGTKYYAFTLRFNPSIQIISSENDNFVSVSLKVANPERFSLIYKGHDYSNAEKDFEFNLKRWEAFTISNCNDAQAYMTGSTITGLKTIGVISGNCPGRTYSRFCNLPSSHTLGESATDIVAEMLRPETGSGTEFIFVGIPARSSSPSAMVVSTAKNTLVDIVTSADGRTVSWIFLKPGEWKEFEADFIKGNCVIKSDQNVHVLIVQSSPCSNIDGYMVEPLGDAAISLLIPNSQFFMRYHWNTAGTSKKTYIVIVAEWPNTTDLLLDDKTLSSDVEWAQVFGSTKFRVANIEVSQNSHSLVSTKFKYFGLYLYGLSEQMAYMHPVGFNGCKFNSTLTKINFDKDCDYPSDKEMYGIIESGQTDAPVG
ncbi:unnamed protein product [Lymnaea stagnalis]|uniref:IgGFc-binding protein N-terminal domain-containing protein n=1 Tax=Lymnaea stagnalis TaxID=6523 RepID=A0AAV2HB97_LYMST